MEEGDGFESGVGGDEKEEEEDEEVIRSLAAAASMPIAEESNTIISTSTSAAAAPEPVAPPPPPSSRPFFTAAFTSVLHKHLSSFMDLKTAYAFLGTSSTIASNQEPFFPNNIPSALKLHRPTASYPDAFALHQLYRRFPPSLQTVRICDPLTLSMSCPAMRDGCGKHIIRLELCGKEFSISAMSRFAGILREGGGGGEEGKKKASPLPNLETFALIHVGM